MEEAQHDWSLANHFSLIVQVKDDGSPAVVTQILQNADALKGMKRKLELYLQHKALVMRLRDKFELVQKLGNGMLEEQAKHGDNILKTHEALKETDGGDQMHRQRLV